MTLTAGLNNGIDIGTPAYPWDVHGVIHSDTNVITPQLQGTVDTLSGATPAINAAHEAFTITLSANAVPTITGIALGARLKARICQGATVYTLAWPTAIHGGAAITTTANTCTSQDFYSFDGTTMDGTNVTGFAL